MGVAALFSAMPNAANATQTVRELFDNLPNNLNTSDGTTVNGMTNDATSVGLSSGFWTNNPPDSFGVKSAGIGYKGSWSMDWVLQNLQNNGLILSHSAGKNGLLNTYPGNLATLTNPATMQPYDTYDPGLYATHALDPSAYVNCNAAGTYYFSVRIEKNYSWSAGDSSAGLGLSTGNGTTDHFVGFGVTRPGTKASDGVTDWGDTDYVTQGTLGQAGLTGEPDTGGPYLPLAVGAAQLYNSGAGAVNWAEAGLVVGKLVTSPGGACQLSVFTMLPNATLVLNEGDIVWDATYSFTETSTMTQLLVWMHGNNLEYDAIRVGTTYADVVGLELIGAPTASPASTVYAGTVVTVSVNAQANSGTTPMSFQWLSNSVAMDTTANPSAATSALVLSNTTPSFTANYSVIVSNYFGMLTSVVAHVTVNPAVSPFFTAKPITTSRYLGSPSATFTAYVDGTPPFTYQWKHNGSPIQSPTTTAATSNTLVLPPLGAGDLGSYSVDVSNAYGLTNSGVGANLTVILPQAGSFESAILALSPWGYWHLNDSVSGADPTIYDYWGWNNGAAVNLDTPTFGAPAAPYFGFPNPHLGITVQNGPNNAACKVNLPKLPVWSNSMTIVMWVNNGGVQMLPMNGYGNGYGLRNNNGELIFYWASLGAPSATGSGMDTGLSVPTDGWTFVALVVQPDQVSIYLGNNTSNLVSSTLTGLALPTSDDAGDTAGLPPPGLGRIQWPYSEDGGGAGYNTMTGTWSDVAILYQSLTPQQVTRLYVAGIGAGITGTPDGSGNLVLNWTQGGILQQASSVNGPYTDVGGSPVAPYSVPLQKSGNKFYRAR